MARVYTEGVRQFQPRVELWHPWDKEYFMDDDRNPEGLRNHRNIVNRTNPFRVWTQPMTAVYRRVAKAQPWAEISEHLRCKARAHREFQRVVHSKSKKGRMELPSGPKNRLNF